MWPERWPTRLAELKSLWNARCVAAVVFGPGDEPVLTATDATLAWQHLPAERRRALAALRSQPALATVAEDGGASVLLEHPDGPLALWIDVGEQRPFSAEDLLLLSLLGSNLAQGLARVHQIDQQRETAIALQRAILGPSLLPDGFAVRLRAGHAAAGSRRRLVRHRPPGRWPHRHRGR